MQTLRELHKDARRTEILRAARDLVAEGGVDALTMRSVAERAHVSVPTIYNLIGNRAQVLSALMDAGGDQLRDLLVASTDAEPTTAIIEACEALATVVAPNAAVVAAVLANGISGPIGDDSLFARFRRVSGEAFADARTAGRLDPSADPDLLTDRCVALAAGAVISWATDHHDEDRLRDELVHGSMLVLAAHVDDDERPRVRRELDRRARRLVRHRARPGRPRSRRAPAVSC